MIRWLHGHMLLQPSFFASPQPLYDVRIFPLYFLPLFLQAPFSHSNHYFHCFPLSVSQRFPMAFQYLYFVPFHMLLPYVVDQTNFLCCILSSTAFTFSHYFHCFPLCRLLSSLLSGYLRSFIPTAQYCSTVWSFQTDGTVGRL